jgi:hypothetical protein
MTDPDHKAWEIALEGLSNEERDRILRLGNALGVDLGCGTVQLDTSETL